MTIRQSMMMNSSLIRTCAAAAVSLSGLASPAAAQQEPVVPAAPTAAAARAEGARVRITWTDNSGDETGFKVDRVPQFKDGSVVVDRDTTELVDEPGRGTFSYRVRAYNSGGESGATDPVSVRILRGAPRLHDGKAGDATPKPTKEEGSPDGVPEVVAPGSPEHVTLQMNGSTAVIAWRDRLGNAEGFELLRQAFSGGVWHSTVVRALPARVESFQDGPLSSGTYRYQLRAINSAGVSAYTAWVVGAVPLGMQGQPTQQAALPPAAPSGLTVADIGNGRAMVSWTDNSSNETGFRVERDPAFESGQVSVGIGATAYIDQCGAGSFGYRVRAINDGGVSAFTGWVHANITTTGTGGGGSGGTVPSGSVGQDGWTVFNPSPDTRQIYVSSSGGNDANNGLTEQTPKRTIAAGYELLRDGYPDWLLLKSGDEWNERLWWKKSGRSETELMRLGAYGTGARPKLFTGAEGAIEAIAPNHLGQKGHVAFTDLHLRAHTYNGSNGGPNGLSMLGYWTDVVIENCLVEGFFVNMPLQGSEGYMMTKIRVRRNIIVDAYKVGAEGHSQGLYLAYCNGGTIEENLLDHNGWNETVSGADPTIFRHNAYIHPGCTTNITTRANIVARGAASGLRSGGDISEFNLCLANPVNLIAGQTTRTIRYNVVLDSRDILPSNPIGIGITGQFRDCEVYGNILAYRTAPTTYNIAAIQVTEGSSNSRIHDNVVFKWTGAGDPNGSAVFVNGAMTGVSIKDNVLQQPAGGRLAWAEPASPQAPAFEGNRYFSTSPAPFATPGLNTIFGATYPQWLSRTSEAGSQHTQTTFPDPGRTIGTYMQSLGRSPTLEAFLSEARKQTRQTWRQEFTARAAGDYFRTGFGVSVQQGE
jgi:hypothetical protein